MYQCSVCGKSVSNDLKILIQHTEEHIVDIIKKKHPEWIEKDGVCQKCVEYYRKQLKG